jgi:hypothetical protein
VYAGWCKIAASTDKTISIIDAFNVDFMDTLQRTVIELVVIVMENTYKVIV